MYLQKFYSKGLPGLALLTLSTYAVAGPEVRYKYSDGHTTFETDLPLNESTAADLPLAAFRQRYIGQLQKTLVTHPMSIQEAGEKRIEEMKGIIANIEQTQLGVPSFQSKTLTDLKTPAAGGDGPAPEQNLPIDSKEVLLETLNLIDSRFPSDTRTAYRELGRLYPYYQLLKSKPATAGGPAFIARYEAIQNRYFVEGWLNISTVRLANEKEGAKARAIRHFVNNCASDPTCRASNTIPALILVNAFLPTLVQNDLWNLQRMVESAEFSEAVRTTLKNSEPVQELQKECMDPAPQLCPGAKDLSDSVLAGLTYISAEAQGTMKEILHNLIQGKNHASIFVD